MMYKRAFLVTAISSAATLAFAAIAQQAEASTTYSCPLSGSQPCASPLSGTAAGDVTVTSGGYQFNPSADDTPGYVQLSNSNQIPMTNFPITVTVQVMGVGVPSSLVGDYDVVRGSKAANWKIEIVARNRRTTAKASCYFKGTSGKAAVTGGPNLAGSSTWHTITCTDTGSAIQTFVDGSLVATKSITTGSIPNTGSALIGAKDTSGGDQFSGWARNLSVQVP